MTHEKIKAAPGSPLDCLGALSHCLKEHDHMTDFWLKTIERALLEAQTSASSQQTRGEVPEGYVVVPSRICMRDESGKSNPEHFAWMGRALMALPKGHGGSNGTMEMYGNAILSTSPAPPVAGKDRGE